MELKKEYIIYSMEEQQIMASTYKKPFSGMINWMKDEIAEENNIQKTPQEHNATEKVIYRDVGQVI